jgi:hypothetical protein
LPNSFFVNAILSQTGGMIAHDSIACQAVGTWSAKGTWTMTNAIAVAASKLDTLAELALDITNDARDANELPNPGKIQAGTQVNVVRLLELLSIRTHYGVVAATLFSPKSAYFGKGNASDGYHESQVMAVFQESPEPYATTCSCMPIRAAPLCLMLASISGFGYWV